MDSRILQVTHSLNIGGLERVVVDLARGFIGMGCAVDIACLAESSPLGEVAREYGARVFSLKKKPGLDYPVVFRLVNRIRRERYEVIHTHNAAGLIYGGTAALLARAPLIIHTEHGKEPGYENKKLLNSVEHFLMKRVNHVVVVSQELKKSVQSSADLASEKITVIPNGIAVSDFYQPNAQEDTRISLGIDRDDFVIGSIGRLVPLKNHKFLFELLEGLRKDFPKVRLVLVGDGPMRKRLVEECNAMGLSDQVLFLGERRDIPALLSAMELFILPSFTEGISITLIEAMAAGKTVVASDVGGNPEIITNGKTGFLIPLDDKQEWIELIRQIIREKTLRQNLAERARQRAFEHFDLAHMITNYRKIYQDGR